MYALHVLTIVLYKCVQACIKNPVQVPRVTGRACRAATPRRPVTSPLVTDPRHSGANFGHGHLVACNSVCGLCLHQTRDVVTHGCGSRGTKTTQWLDVWRPCVVISGTILRHHRTVYTRCFGCPRPAPPRLGPGVLWDTEQRVDRHPDAVLNALVNEYFRVMKHKHYDHCYLLSVRWTLTLSENFGLGVCPCECIPSPVIFRFL